MWMTRGTPTTRGWKQLRIISMTRTVHQWDSSSSTPVNTFLHLFSTGFDLSVLCIMIPCGLRELWCFVTIELIRSLAGCHKRLVRFDMFSCLGFLCLFLVL